jgi:hypothetical protein
MMAASREPFATAFRYGEWNQDVFMKSGKLLEEWWKPSGWHSVAIHLARKKLIHTY